MSPVSVKVLIIGSGPAGYTAAIYSARAMLDPVLLSGEQPGGQLSTTTEVENYPGFPDTIQGPWLMEQMRDQAVRHGTKVVTEHAVEVHFTHSRPCVAKVVTNTGVTYEAESLIIATGAQARWLGIPSETKFRGFGVSACSTCDGFFFREKDVLVIGGGNSAVEEALYLTKYANKVTLVHRRDQLRAEKVLQSRLFDNPKIQVIWNSKLEEVLGTENPTNVTGALLRDTKSNEVTEVSTDGIFISIGHDPSTSIFGEQLKVTPTGYIWTEPNSTVTSIPGVFAAGDVTDDRFRQAVTAAGLGCMAAIEAEHYLASM